MSKEYRRRHPTISFRCRSIDEYDAIKQMVARSGKSESTYIRELILSVEKQESQSYNRGCSDSSNKFTVPCSICKKPMTFDLNNNAEATQKINETFGNYAHTTCIEEQKNQQEIEQRELFEKTYFNNYSY